jgi:PIN domain nuclease of toxin-antitoxin system
MIHVTDTHALVWYLNDDARLSEAARAVFTDPNAHIVIPTLVLAEIAFLHVRGRITTDVSAVLNLLPTLANCTIAPFDEVTARHIPTNLDIHDAIIVATAIVYRDVLGEDVTVITRDGEITNSGIINVLW